MIASSDSRKMGLNATWSMAVGGMVGGGIFSVLGVVAELAGPWAWLSFLIGGLIALATGWSYSQLAHKFGEGGGAFTFLREVHRDGLAGSLSWVLVAGYVLTISVYAFTFGHYLGHVLGLGAPWVRLSGVAIIALLLGVNVMGVGEAAWLEIITVWGKLAILVALAAVGLWAWQPAKLSAGAGQAGLGGALIGAASVFMAYEGFQLLAYDYEDIRNPRKTLPLAVLSAIIAVIAVYIVVAIGSAMLVTAGALIEHKEVALSYAGQAAAGQAGLIAVSVAAVFSTASAINATLFATARLTRLVADDKELPRFLAHTNQGGIPDRALMMIAAAAIALTVLGGLTDLVEAASLAFLFTFAVVNVIAALKTDRANWVGWVGGAGATAAGVTLLVRLSLNSPWALAALVALALLATLGRPLLLRWLRD